jgi:adenylate cyclase
MSDRTDGSRTEWKLDRVLDYAKSQMKNYQYHNYAHAKEVYHAVDQLASLEGISDKDRHLLMTAAGLHDLICEPGYALNEEKSAIAAKNYCLDIGYSVSDAYAVGKLILATKLSRQPMNKLEMIMRDADLDNLGQDEFWTKNEQLRLEHGEYDLHSWYSSTLEFMNKHTYYTDSAKLLRDEGKKRNIVQLRERIQEIENYSSRINEGYLW